jgi:hypothetical protein
MSRVKKNIGLMERLTSCLSRKKLGLWSFYLAFYNAHQLSYYLYTYIVYRQIEQVNQVVPTLLLLVAEFSTEFLSLKFCF